MDERVWWVAGAVAVWLALAWLDFVDYLRRATKLAEQADGQLHHGDTEATEQSQEGAAENPDAACVAEAVAKLAAPYDDGRTAMLAALATLPPGTAIAMIHTLPAEASGSSSPGGAILTCSPGMSPATAALAFRRAGQTVAAITWHPARSPFHFVHAKAFARN